MSTVFHGITAGRAYGKPGAFLHELVAAGSTLLTGLVSWWDLDEWEGPDGKGVSLNFFVTELDASEWVLRLQWQAGVEGDNLRPLGWEEIVDLPA